MAKRTIKQKATAATRRKTVKRRTIADQVSSAAQGGGYAKTKPNSSAPSRRLSSNPFAKPAAAKKKPIPKKSFFDFSN